PNHIHSGRDLAAWAQAAEAAGLDLVVVGDHNPDGAVPGLDTWTAATWVAASTARIAIGLASPSQPAPEPTDPRIPVPAVVDKARESLDTLAGPRLVTSGWILAPASPDADQI